MSNFLFYLILTVGLLICCSCKDDNPIEPRTIAHTITFKLNGGSYSQSLFTLSIPAYPVSGAIRNRSDSSTWCRVHGGPSSVPYSVDLFLSSDTAGSYPWGESFPKNNSVRIEMSSLLHDSAPQLHYSTQNGMTLITAYGGVGEKVAGNFSGKLLDRALYDTIDVAGSFSFTRMADASERSLLQR